MRFFPHIEHANAMVRGPFTLGRDETRSYKIQSLIWTRSHKIHIADMDAFVTIPVIHLTSLSVDFPRPGRKC